MSDLDVAETTVETTGNAAVSSGAQPNPLADEYKKRFNGLQAKHQVQQEELARLESLQKQATLQITSLTEEKTRLANDLAAREQAIAEREKEKASMQYELDRLSILVDEFPQFRQLHKENPNALPAGSGDDFRASLSALAALMNNQQQSSGKAAPNSPPPVPTGRSAAMTPEETKAAAVTALRSGNQAEYNRLMDEYYKMGSK